MDKTGSQNQAILYGIIGLLADDIIAAQTTEIEMMRQWKITWNY